jgi:hypothetical protein
MSGLLVGAELFLALGAFAAAFALIWIAKPKGQEPKFGFLKSETGQILYTVFCICLIAVGFSLGFHGLTGG